MKFLPGKAGSLFLQKQGSNQPLTDNPSHPFLTALYVNGYFSYIDLAAAESIAGAACQEENFLLLLAFLSLASRQGHLCLRIAPVFSPLPAQFNEAELPSDLLGNLLERLLAAAANLPAGSYAQDPIAAFVEQPLVLAGGHLYFQKNWLNETTFYTNLQRLQTTSPSLSPNLQLIQEAVEDMLAKEKLLPEQAEAILNACTHPFTIINGGPGTGKTYTAGQLIRTFWQSLSKTEQEKCRILLTAPTGKAASNLQKSLQAAVADMPSFSPLQAKTLHALLELPKSQTKSINIYADLLLVDECSMIDAEVMSLLMSSIREGTRIVLLGDPFQLPPVESGAVFKNIVEMQGISLPIYTLHKCLRAEYRQIVDFAKAVKSGSWKAFQHELKEDSQAVAFTPFFHEEQGIPFQQQQIAAYVFQQFPKENVPEKLLEGLQTFCLLTPLRKGPFGIEELNELLYAYAIKEKKPGEFFAYPIIITRNSTEQQLFNGDIGVVCTKIGESRSSSLQVGDYALFYEKNAEGQPQIRKLAALLLPQHEKAYALTIHKSQGSEFNNVLLLLPKGSQQFGREALYTAVTRTRKQLTIWGQEKVVKAMLENPNIRISGIDARVHKSN